MPIRRISLNNYSTRSIPVDNPIDLTKIPKGKTYQITNFAFIIQFFFNRRDIFGFILKRDPKYPIRMRWCFFRSCEESPYDYIVTIGEVFQGPYKDEFFRVKFPVGIQYQFQGIKFSNK